jgi:hypothetical protein
MSSSDSKVKKEDRERRQDQGSNTPAEDREEDRENEK